MRSPYNFVVRPVNGRRYDNVVDMGGIELITSVSLEDHTVSNRYAEVIETPISYTGEIEKGDILLVHHNVFKFYFDMKGRKKSGRSFFKDDLFFVDYDQFFLYNHNGKWKSHSDYCFIKPAEKEEHYLISSGTEQPLVGYVKYPDSILESIGLKEGDKVSYLPHSEYPFEIDGEKLYRMKSNRVAIWM